MLEHAIDESAMHCQISARKQTADPFVADFFRRVGVAYQVLKHFINIPIDLLANDSKDVSRGLPHKSKKFL